MYELLTGTRPFRAGNLQKLLHQIVFATPPPIHTLRPEIPEDLEIPEHDGREANRGGAAAREVPVLDDRSPRADQAHRLDKNRGGTLRFEDDVGTDAEGGQGADLFGPLRNLLRPHTDHQDET